jgi:phosphonate degradation associated HDIG domain protein
MPTTVQNVIDLYAARGSARYGSELVSQLEHALQCARLAQGAGADVELVAASFLHDLGHLLAPQPQFMARDLDDLHQYVALPYLRRLFGPAVLEPIRLHVDAKRYLTRAEPGYWDRLPPASKHSLRLQGGPFSVAEASAFLGQRFAREAVRLRRWDDEAKIPGRPVPDLAELTAVLEAAAGCHETAMSGA